MFYAIVFLFFTPTDSIQSSTSDSTLVLSDTITTQSIMFLPKQNTDVAKLKYQHIQGFFCDFEDKINKGKKINLNVGVGEQ